MQKKVDISKDSGPSSRDNETYKALHTRISNLRQYFSPNYRKRRTLTDSQVSERLFEIQRLEKERAKLPSKVLGPGHRIYYVRYADDFIVGINGSLDIAKRLKDEIRDFLQEQLKIELNEEKTHITSAVRSRAKFLGSEIRGMYSRTNDIKRRVNSRTKTGRLVKARTPQGYIEIFAPIETIVKRLESQGICKIKNFQKREIIPTRKTA